MSLPVKAMPVSLARPSAGGRFLFQEESLCALSWLAGISSTFLLIGLVGMLRFELPMIITLSGAAGMGASEVASQDTTMAELQAMEEAPEIVANEVATPEVVDVPETLEVPQDMLDLPELTEALITEDLFTVPAAPRIETALTPVDPALPKPQPKPKPAVAKARPSRATTTAAATPGGTQGSGGGSSKGSATGKNIKSKLKFPSGASSRNVSGSLTLRMQVNAVGEIISATVVSSNCTNGGFTTSEQNQIISDIRRKWRLPSYANSTIVQPVKFELE